MTFVNSDERTDVSMQSTLLDLCCWCKEVTQEKPGTAFNCDSKHRRNVLLR